MGRSLEDLTNEGVTTSLRFDQDMPTFLRELRAERANARLAEKPTSEGDVYKLWARSGGIQKMPRSRGISMGELWGLLAFAVVLGFCFGLFASPALLP